MDGFSSPVFFIFTLLVMGGAGYLTGQALAGTWRAVWQVFVYGLLLGAFDRFLVFALFQGPLLSVPAFLLDGSTIIVISLLAYRMTQARMMVRQYPWLYRRSGLFSWREIGDAR